MTDYRIPTAVVATVLLAVAAVYLSGYLTLMFLGLDTALLQFGSYYQYAKNLEHPQVQPFAWRIVTAGAIGSGMMLLVWASVLVMLFKLRSHRNIHGRARFAGMLDLANIGFLKHQDDGIVVGEMNGKLLRLSGQQFVILAAPTRSGKGVGVVIPNLLDYRESAVVLDIKQENFDLTSGWRKSIGHEIFLFNPFAEDRRSHRWNPMTYVSADPSFRVSDLQTIAAMLYPDGDDRDKFWTSQARNAFLAFTLYLFEHRDEMIREDFADRVKPPTLGAVLRLSSGDGSELKPFLQRLAEASFLSPQARTAFAGLLSQADVTFASIIGAFREPLNPWLNPVLDAATSGDDFRLDDVRRKRMTIYVGIQPNKLAESRLIVNLFFSQLINVNTKTLPQNDKALKHQCLLLMDEFTSIGRVDIISKAVAYMAGYNLRLLPIIQSMAQMDAVYGKELSRTIITNHALQIIYAPREQQDANDYSEMLGYTTVRRRARTRSHGQSYSVSDNEVLERRALMLPQELKAMGPEKEIVIYEGLAHPVLCKKIRYYKDGYFTKRLLGKVDVKPLELDGEKHMKSRTASIVAASTLALLSACASPSGDAQEITADRVLEPKQDHVPTEYRCPSVIVPKERAQALAAEEAMLERMVDTMINDGDIPVDPEHAQRQRSKEPVPFMLGPHTFRLPKNFFYFQNAPSFKPSRDSVKISLQWPCLEPLPDGNDFADDPDTSVRAMRANIDYIGAALGEVMRRSVEPINPDDPQQRTDPRDNLDLRIKGEPVHGGLTPYYGDIDKVEAYFKDIYSDSPRAYRRENVLRNAMEWYLRFGEDGYPLTVIKCDSREIADGLIVEGNTVRDDPDVSRRASCDHEFAIPELGIRVNMFYGRVFLPDWQRIERRVRLLLAPVPPQ